MQTLAAHLHYKLEAELLNQWQKGIWKTSTCFIANLISKSLDYAALKTPQRKIYHNSK